jgi:hypothetical protein
MKDEALVVDGGGDGGDPEVGEVRAPGLVEQHVGRFYIAVHDSEVVKVIEGLRHLAPEAYDP